MRYCLFIAYDGTAYSGWQVQKNGQAIQPLIQQALQTILRHPLDLTGSSRTDAGVHALAQTAHFDSEVPLTLSKLRHSLNALLPPDIRIIDIHPVPDTFHARYSATSKIYRYHIHLEPTHDPHKRNYCYHHYLPFAPPLVQAALPHLLGTHDFTSFASAKNQTTHNIRTLHRIDLIEEPGGIYFEFEGDGFLYKMVRNITGTLLEVASGKRAPNAIQSILKARDRRLAGPTAPAHALFLAKIYYTPRLCVSAPLR